MEETKLMELPVRANKYLTNAGWVPCGPWSELWGETQDSMGRIPVARYPRLYTHPSIAARVFPSQIAEKIQEQWDLDAYRIKPV